MEAQTPETLSRNEPEQCGFTRTFTPPDSWWTILPQAKIKALQCGMIYVSSISRCFGNWLCTQTASNRALRSHWFQICNGSSKHHLRWLHIHNLIIPQSIHQEFISLLLVSLICTTFQVRQSLTSIFIRCRYNYQFFVWIVEFRFY